MTEMLDRVFDRKYRLVRLLGRGGMGSVYEAEHTRIHRKFAVKVMHAKDDAAPGSIERFLLEAQAASAIGHPNIIEIIDVGVEDDGTAFIVMELLEGQTLSEMLDALGLVTEERAISIAAQILSGLQAAHSKGIIHRDLKPDNVFLAVDARGREDVKLLDFGVAKVTERAEVSLSLTKTGAVVGTPYYISPEQARGRKDVDERIDIWAVGVIMYEMLAGRLPFQGENYNAVMGSILMDPPPPIAELAPGAAPGVIAVIEQAMAKDRDERFATAKEMLQALLPLLEDARGNMTTGVFQIIGHTSSIPPAPVDPRFRVEIPEGGGRPSSPDLRDSDPNAMTLPPDFARTDTGTSGAARPSNRRRAVIAGIGAALVVALMVILVAVVGGGEDSGDQREGSASALRAQARPSTAEVDDHAEAPAPAGAKADTSAAASQPVTPPETVTIELADLPDGATVTLDGRLLAPPFAVPYSGEPAILRVTASGRVNFERAITPDRDQRIAVSMPPGNGAATVEQPPAADVAEDTDDPRRKRSRRKKPKRGDSWADNPFG